PPGVRPRPLRRAHPPRRPPRVPLRPRPPARPPGPRRAGPRPGPGPAAGALRQRAALDAALAPHLAGGLSAVRDDLLDILRVGAYQLLFLERVPRHAAVDTAVMLGRRLSGARVGGFINAVLRKVADESRRAPGPSGDDGGA